MVIADREMVENMAEQILEEAQASDVAFLVVGDPFGYVSILQHHGHTHRNA